jgi:hypothetical protein
MKCCPVTSPKRDLRFPVAGIGRETVGSQNIKSDLEWHSGLAKCESDSRLRTGSDFWKFYFLSLYRDVSIAIENSPKLITPKSVHGNILPGSHSQLESVQVVLRI